MTNDVWIVSTTYYYGDGSKERMINSVHGERETAEASLERRQDWKRRGIGLERRRFGGKEVVRQETEIQRWFVI